MTNTIIEINFVTHFINLNITKRSYRIWTGAFISRIPHKIVSSCCILKPKRPHFNHPHYTNNHLECRHCLPLPCSNISCHRSLPNTIGLLWLLLFFYFIFISIRIRMISMAFHLPFHLRLISMHFN